MFLWSAQTIELIGIPHSFYRLEDLDNHQGDHASRGIESSGTRHILQPKQKKRINPRFIQHFLVIVVESAGLYASVCSNCLQYMKLIWVLCFTLLRCWAVFFAVAYETESNVQSCVIQTAPALVGIVNALIHTRVGLGWTSEQAERLPWPASPLRFAGRDAIGE